MNAGASGRLRHLPATSHHLEGNGRGRQGHLSACRRHRAASIRSATPRNRVPVGHRRPTLYAFPSRMQRPRTEVSTRDAAKGTSARAAPDKNNSGSAHRTTRSSHLTFSTSWVLASARRRHTGMLVHIASTLAPNRDATRAARGRPHRPDDPTRAVQRASLHRRAPIPTC